LGHNISKKSLDAFHESGLDASEEAIAEKMASLLSFSPSPNWTENPKINTEIISAEFARLAPSELPPPAGYYGMTSSSGNDSDSDTSFSGISHLRRDRSFLPKSFASYSNMDGLVVDEKDEDSSDEMDEEDDEDDDESIDMLAQARGVDPGGVATREQEFEVELNEMGEPSDVPVRSSAATVNDESGNSSDSSDY
jgi:hypothetical protein